MRGGLDPACFPTPLTEPSLAVSQWKLRMDTYGWESIQPSQPKQAIIRTGFDLTSSSAEFYSFSLPVGFTNVASTTARTSEFVYNT